MQPQVSIVLPFFNAAATLEETLDSIAGQTFGDYELVAVDDGSTDHSAAIVRGRQRHDSRIRLLQPAHGGVVRAMNHGLVAARAPLVARMDADDRMHPERLAAQVQYLDDRGNIDLVGSQVRLFPEEAIEAGFREYIRWQNGCITPEQISEQIYVELPIANPSVMFRRNVIVGLGGFRDGPFPEDYELQLRLHHYGRRMAKIPRVLLEWRDSPSRLTRNHPRYGRAAFDRARAWYLARDPRLSPSRNLAFWGAGRKTRLRTRHLLGHGLRPTAWIDIDPNKIGNTIEGVPVVDPEWLARPERPFVLSWVTNHGARDLITQRLEQLGYRSGRDYLMVG